MSCEKQFQNALIASRALNKIDDESKQKVLCAVSDALVAATDEILHANKSDLERMGKEHHMYDRLLLTEQRIRDIASDTRNVASLPSPLGKVLSETVRPNGMKITKISVPFGVIGVIYEARPNVSVDVFSICFKSGNVSILKGGSDAKDSNEAIVSVIKNVLRKFGLDENMVTLLPADRSATAELLDARDYVDLIIPRGSRSLIDFVRNNAKIPVIETGAGVCHTYFDKAGDLEKGANVIFNAKTRRVSVCNALDSVVVHSERLKDLPALCEKLATKNVLIYADDRSYQALSVSYPLELLRHADKDSYGTEFQSYTMSLKTVDSLEAAIDHITHYTSHHSEVIITEDEAAAALFQKSIDAACVYVNVSTAFTDGAQFGFGAEIGISTQKLHARGPMALPELTTYKYLITGNGQTRS